MPPPKSPPPTPPPQVDDHLPSLSEDIARMEKMYSDDNRILDGIINYGQHGRKPLDGTLSIGGDVAWNLFPGIARNRRSKSYKH